MTGSLSPLLPLTRTVTARDVVMGAATSRDWQPQHHDIAYAQGMHLPDIIMNAPTQTGWFHAYAMAWAGPGARIGRWRLKMRRPICPGADVTYSGAVTRQEPALPGHAWIWLALQCEGGGELLSSMTLLLAQPTYAETSCWDITAENWAPPPLQ
ncbi:hypothetical protein NT2_05_04670 [Caenibius tardaugens NBRC 16725]|uniref:MaoC-like domain-containing protein n=1 Tax=Caenibius tardaugens NBRC 16725 TaxID=1219035 RepID=U2Y8H5_9SPHN|nr:MaoC/PaaZ C-terminal domain-containing protein [Caenibius tardaugens]AZI36864.1 hypothetical protein EGO55_13595 [Caenibius tardaugens NBRC 16725]GAD49546.1 hypothetical protein NT2_05_04670 [Caenibius tardaugens NBRC 16725]